jgi:hypothetical protein
MKPRRVVQTLVVLLCVVFSACATRQLSSFKEKQKAGDYTGIAQQTVKCESIDDVCGQLHLIKGDACFRLAMQNSNAVQQYACAVTELEKGIQYTKTWQQGDAQLNRPQTYANLCESLRAWQDQERGADAERLTQRLLDVSERFLVAEPGHPAAVYYNVSARYALLRPDLLHPQDAQRLCRQLDELTSLLNAALPRSSRIDYKPHIMRLQSDIDGAKRTIAGCR